MAPNTGTSDLHLPRILCLHGGGSNARIFRTQCRVIKSFLRPRFRLCFPNAPLPADAGPDVLSVYDGWGPFRAWIPPAWIDGVPEQDAGKAGAAIRLVEDVLAAAMHADDRAGGHGPWVGILGFSQGAKIAASVLLRRQQQTRAGRAPRFPFRFGVLLAGRGPIFSDSVAAASDTKTSGVKEQVVIRIQELSDEDEEDSEEAVDSTDDPIQVVKTHVRPEDVLRVPTVHVHGLRDPNLHLHRRLRGDWCEESMTTLFEWDGGHRVPIRTQDVTVLVDHILEIAEATGVPFAQS